MTNRSINSSGIVNVEDLRRMAQLAPVGYSRLMNPEGEIGAAGAASDAGTGYTLSTISGHRLEDVKAA